MEDVISHAQHVDLFYRDGSYGYICGYYLFEQVQAQECLFEIYFRTVCLCVYDHRRVNHGVHCI